jgi:transposase-like protein
MEKKKQLRTRRYFSEELRREIVKKIEHKELSISGASREYEVSGTSLYQWIYRYSLHLKKGIRLVMEKNSHSERIKALQDRLAALEQAVGQKQMEIDILNKMLEFGSEDVGFDIKKKFGGKFSSGTKTTKNTTTTKRK